MMRSLYSGVAGLQNHQTRMDVVGNNVANVNTIGFKKNRVNFQDMLYQGVQGAAKPTEELGGVNPKQVGLGVMVSSIDTVHTQGAMQSTGIKSDLAIQGDGFFILKKGESSVYTRAGAFGIDADGTLVNPANGMKVQGWAAETVGGVTSINATGDTSDMQIPMYGKDPARATELVRLMCNLNKTTAAIDENATPAQRQAATWVVTKDIYDSFGNTHQLRIDYTRDAANPNQWQGTISIDAQPGEIAANAANVAIGVDGQALNGTNFILNFDNNGALASLTDGAGAAINAGALNLSVAFDVPDATPDAAGAATRQQFNVEVGTIGSYEDSTTQFASPSTNKSFFQDGYTMGYLTAYDIDANGVINGTFSNGQKRELGQLAMATFTNPEGLEKVGETNFARTSNSGDALIDPAGLAGKGKINAGMLEMSNVDLSAEFVDMIVTQRGFEANSKGIQTSDQMLQTIMQLKR